MLFCLGKDILKFLILTRNSFFSNSLTFFFFFNTYIIIILFFLAGKNNSLTVYYDNVNPLSSEQALQIPPEVNLIYWDCK